MNEIKVINDKYLELYDKAIKASKNSYSPYSKFSVGASLLTDDGKIFVGTNVENASYGLTMCAERNVLFSAYANGYKKNNIEALLITANTNKPVSPCGACRQVISELVNNNTIIVLTNLKKEMIECRIDELLPYSFDEGDLNE